MLHLKDVQSSTAVMAQLQQHREYKAELTHKYVILFYISISVINCRKSGLHIAVGSKVSTKGIDIKYSKSCGYKMCQLGMEISILGVY